MKRHSVPGSTVVADGFACVGGIAVVCALLAACAEPSPSLDDRVSAGDSPGMDSFVTETGVDAAADAPRANDVAEDTAAPADVARDAAARVAAVDRVVFFYTPHGTIPAQWTVTGTGAAWTPGGILQPLTPFRNQLSVIAGIDMPVTPHENVPAHTYGPGAVLTGWIGPETQAGFQWVAPGGGPSLDVVLGGRETTQFGSVYLGVSTRSELSRISWLARSMSAAPDATPAIAYTHLFGGATDSPALVALRASIAARSDWASDTAFADATRIDLDLVRELFVTDRTRVATLQLCDAGSCNAVFTWAGASVTSGYTSLAHSSLSDATAYTAIQHWFAQQLAYLLQSLHDTPTADGMTLLDHTLVVWLSETGNAPTHSHLGIPVVLAGNVSGRVHTGQYLQLTHRNEVDLLLTIAQAMAPGITTFGDPAMTARPIRELLVP